MDVPETPSGAASMVTGGGGKGEGWGGGWRGSGDRWGGGWRGSGDGCFFSGFVAGSVCAGEISMSPGVVCVCVCVCVCVYIWVKTTCKP